MESKTGIFVIGVLKGYSESTWANPQSGKSGINRRLGIITGDYTDQWGAVHENIETVDVPQDMAQVIKQQAEQLKDRPVKIAIGVFARAGGRNGAWAAYVMRKGTEITALSAPAAKPQAVAAK